MVRLKTVTVYPALIKCPHIDRPITPVPIHPILVFDGVIRSEEIDEEAIERRRKKEDTTEGDRDRRRSGGSGIVSVVVNGF